MRVRTNSRENFYSLAPGHLDDLLRPTGIIQWENSVPLYRALEILWLGIWDPINDELDHLTLCSQFSRLAKQVEPLLGDAEFGSAIGSKMAHRENIFLQGFEEDVKSLLNKMATI